MNRTFLLCISFGCLAVSLALYCIISFGSKSVDKKAVFNDEPLVWDQGDWPHFMGLTCNNISPETNLVSAFSGNFRLCYRLEIGGGYSGISVSGERAFTCSINKKNKTNIIYCFHALSGDIIWSRSFPAWIGKRSYNPDLPFFRSQPAQSHGGTHGVVESGKDFDKRWCGPKASPLIYNGKVYTLSHEGMVHCLNITNGDIIWLADLMGTYQGRPPRFGYAASPLLRGNLIILPLFADGANFIALHKDTGAMVWRGGERLEGYATPAVCEIDNKPVLIDFSGFGLQAISIESGLRLWLYSYYSGTGESVMLPQVKGSKVFISSWYLYRRSHLATDLPTQGRAILFDVSTNQARVIWQNDNLANWFSDVVLFNDTLIGFDGRDQRTLRCVDFETGALLWKKQLASENDSYSLGTILAADGKLFILSHRGTLHLLRFSRKAYEPLDNITVAAPRQNWYSPISLSRGYLYCRGENGSVLCYDLAKK